MAFKNYNWNRISNVDSFKSLRYMVNTNSLVSSILIGRGEYDWQAGANSPIERKVLVQDGNWKALSIPHEVQVVNLGELSTYDSMMCVSYNGVTDALEYILMQMLRLNMIPPYKVTWLKDKGYFENGCINFSERFVGTLGETTSAGAYQYKIANAAKNYGLIPQKMFQPAKTFSENIDKKFITPEMLALGREFAKLFRINYEWIQDFQTREFLKYSPVSCYGRYGTGEGILSPTEGGYHSMLQVAETNEYREIDDSYWQQFKKYKKTSLEGFMVFYIDASENQMFILKDYIASHDLFLIRNTITGAYGVIYQGKGMLITPERAGLFLIDRDARGLIGRKDLSTTLSDYEFEKVFDGSIKF